VVLDEMGAERLLGNGDMLFLLPGTSTLIRGQGTYVSDDESARVIDAVATSEPQFVTELVQLKTADSEEETRQLNNRDELYESAIDVVVREGRGSVSLLQRSLGIGYGRAARLIDYMAEDGIVGPYNGSQAREVLLSLDEWDQMHGRIRQDQPAPKPRRHSNTILLTPAARSQAAAAPASRPSHPIASPAIPPWAEEEEEEESDEPPEDDSDEQAYEDDAPEDEVEAEDAYDELDDDEEELEEEEDDDGQYDEEEEEEEYDEAEEDYEEEGDEEYDEEDEEYEDEEEDEDWEEEEEYDWEEDEPEDEEDDE
jgi:S-DNA-T family DNA segregation ATPase FtsK/SpoIIIE